MGSNGTIVHFDGSKWTMMESPTAWDLWDVYGITPVNVYAVAGENSYDNMGKIIHYDGTSWKTVLEATGRLNSVWGSSSTDVYAVGPGIMHHFDGIEWSTTYPPVSSGIWEAIPLMYIFSVLKQYCITTVQPGAK